MRDLVLSVVKNRRWWDLDCYAVSLDKSGFEGARVMLAEDVTLGAQDMLRRLGFEVVDCRTPPTPHFQTTRYLPALEFLRARRGEFKNVMWTDVCDLVFQSDPSPAIEAALRGKSLLAFKEGWAIKDQAINDVWIQRLGLSPAEYSWLREQEVLCSGTIAGTCEGVIALFEAMCARISGLDHMQGMDQGLFNQVVRTAPFCYDTRIPEPDEGFVSTCGIFLAPSDPSTWTIRPPVFDRSTGLVMTPDGSRPYAVAHQYNRAGGQLDPSGDWRGALERRWRA